MALDISSTIKKLENARVLVVGDVMLDTYYMGDTDRIAKEAPSPVVHVRSKDHRPGGAANVALNVASFSESVELCGIVGHDAAARTLQDLLNQKSVKHHFIKSQSPTVTKIRVISRSQQTLRLDFEEPFTQNDESALLEKVTELIRNFNVMVLSDYGKGSIQCPQKFILLASEHNVSVVVNPKSRDRSIYAGCHLITPNMEEFQLIAGQISSQQELLAKASRLIKDNQIRSILITQAEDGMTLVNEDESSICYPALSSTVRDVTGAGDTVVAVMGAALSVGMQLTSAADLANRAASIVVKKFGASCLDEEDLQQLMCFESQSNISEEQVVKKVFTSWEELKTKVDEEKAGGRKVVFTNGCFDILHPGHVSFLRQVSKLADFMVVALNSDDSIRRLKGPDRPVLELQHRMALVSVLPFVDGVTFFTEDTPHEIIKCILPDVLAKGADYRIENIVGAKEVMDRGGRVYSVQSQPSLSSSAFIKKIQSTKY